MPKFNGPMKSKANGKSSRNRRAATREEAIKNKYGTYKGVCERGHNSTISTKTNKCHTCIRLKLYEE